MWISAIWSKAGQSGGLPVTPLTANGRVSGCCAQRARNLGVCGPFRPDWHGICRSSGSERATGLLRHAGRGCVVRRFSNPWFLKKRSFMMSRRRILSVAVMLAALGAGLVIPEREAEARCCRQRCCRQRCCRTRSSCCYGGTYAYSGGYGCSYGCGTTGCATGACAAPSAAPDGTAPPAPQPGSAPAPAPAPPSALN